MSLRRGSLLTGVGAALVLALTLWPSAGDAQRELGFWCLLCGSRDVADGFLNVLLFAPLGAGLCLLQGPFLALGGSFALSGLVELIQSGLPGRFSTLGDLFFNCAGGMAGAFIVAHLSRLRSMVSTPSWKVRTMTLLLPLGAFVATAVLSSPQLPDTKYYGQWTHELGSMEPYPGRVLSASVGGVSLPDGRVPDQEGAKEALRIGIPIRLSVLAGPEPPELSHLFAIYDDHPREILLVAVQGPDLVFQRRTLSARLLLDQPLIRWPGVMKADAGDTIQIILRQGGTTLCVEANTRVRCDLPSGVEGGWRLFLRLSEAPPLLVGLLSFLWVFFLSVPTGITSGSRRRAFLMGLALAGIGALISWRSPWLSVHAAALVSPLLGAWAGHLMRPLFAHRV